MPQNRPDFSSARTGGSDVWLTPPWILDAIRANYTIALDPCTEPSNPTGALLRLCGQGPDWDDGLAADWANDLTLFDGDPRISERAGICYVNPPYGGLSRNGPWGLKIEGEAEKGCPIISLLPARTNQSWFQRLARLTFAHHGNVLFLDRRLKFHGADGQPHATQAPFPSVIMTFNCEMPGPLWDKGWMPCCQ